MKARGGAPISSAEFAGLIGANQTPESAHEPITRGAACAIMYDLIKAVRKG